FYMAHFFVISVISQILYIMMTAFSNAIFTASHILKVLSFFYVYKALVETSLHAPYTDLNRLNINLLNKTQELIETNSALTSEIERRNRAEKSLKEEREIIQGILESTTEGVIVKDKNKQTTYVNSGFKKMFETAKRDVKEKKDICLRHMALEFFINPETFIRNLDNAYISTDYISDRAYLKDGRVLEYNTHPLQQRGKITGRVWNFKDITGKFRTEERFRKLVEIIPDAVILHNGHELIYANPSTLKIAEMKHPVELIGQDIMDLVHPESVELVRNKIHKILQGAEKELFIEHKIITAKGRTVDVENRIVEFKDESQRLIISVIRDMSERKIAEDLRRKIEEEKQLLREAEAYDSMKTEFFSNISHELRTPLNIILSCIQLADKNYNERDQEDREKHTSLLKHIHMMKQNAYRLLRLINNLIDITRVDSGFMKMNLRNYNIVYLVEEITLSVSEYIQSKGKHIIFDTEIEEKYMACDGDKIERIMLNLLSNAIKFTGSDGTIYVSIFDREDRILVSVKDTGIGIPQKMHQKVFERFRQVEPLYNRRAEGSGIGLSLVKAFVEMHGGKIWVKSKPGVGSEFIIELPAKQVDSEDTSYEEIEVAIETNVERIKVEFSDIYS
ncbi:MAG: ATP-binding protein, partial [Thermotaleaceae bacterium]